MKISLQNEFTELLDKLHNNPNELNDEEISRLRELNGMIETKCRLNQ